MLSFTERNLNSLIFRKQPAHCFRSVFIVELNYLNHEGNDTNDEVYDEYNVISYIHYLNI